MTLDDWSGMSMLVSGGASGIGRAVALGGLARGARVALLDRQPCDEPAEAVRLVADVTDDAQVSAAVDEAASRLGGLDVLITCAGIGAQGTVEENGLDEWARLYDVNVLGLVRAARAALPHLRRSEHACIVNVSSIVAAVGLPRRAAYSASKGAVLALTRAMAVDHLQDGIRVNCVSPGTADTPWVQRLLDAADDPAAERRALEGRQPLGRLVTAEEVAEAILYLAAPSSGATTGAELAVDGGVVGLRMPR